MDIIQRNFIRLLKCGAFGQQAPLEPMSEWKWQRLYRVSLIHGVTPWIADGIKKSSDDFFLQLPSTLYQQFVTDKTDRFETFKEQHLTNPFLDRKLHSFATEDNENNATFDLLCTIIAIARNILTQGISLRQFIMLGTFIRQAKTSVNYEQLKAWIKDLGMNKIARLEGSLLMELLGFGAHEILFADATIDKQVQQAVKDMFQMTEKHAADWYFTQGKSIFVRSNDSAAMIWQVKHSARYMHYYPSEAFTNFLANFAHSLAHIEE